jgi:hypothetical protein
LFKVPEHKLIQKKKKDVDISLSPLQDGKVLEGMTVRCKVPQHLDEGIGQRVEVDVELAHYSR